MRYIFLSLIGFLFNGFAIAHDANKAFFTITQKDTIFQVEMEFPWSIQNALLKFDPTLESSTSQLDFDIAFLKYIDLNFQMIDLDGKLMKQIDFSKVDGHGHSHQSNYLFSYAGNGLSSISNTIMFNIVSDHENYHDLDIENQKATFVTHHNQNDFVLVKPVSMLKFLWIPLALLGFFLVFRYLR